TFGDASSDLRFEELERDEVEQRGPDDGCSGAQDPGRDYGRDGVGGVVKAVDEVERQRQRDHGQERDAHQPYSSTTPSRMFAMSSQRSVAASRLSYMSRHFSTSSGCVGAAFPWYSMASACLYVRSASFSRRLISTQQSRISCE